MSLLWIVAVSMTPGIEQVPTETLGDPGYRRAWGYPDHPVMAALMDRIRGDGGYDPQRHGTLHVKADPEGGMERVSLPREHHISGFGENSGHALAFALHHLGHTSVPAMVTRDAPRKAEKDPTRARVFYHGTTTDQPLSEITPLSERHPHRKMLDSGEHKGNTFSDPGFAYATTDRDDAWHWAQEAWHKNPVGMPRVFKVRRRGPVEADPNFSGHSNAGQVRSRHGFDVVGEEPMPHGIRHIYHDDGE